MTRQGERLPEHDHFWELAEPYLASGALNEGTIMGHQCLRVASNDGFVATVQRGTGALIVKLPKQRVAELVESGVGESFAPAGKVFREWVALSALAPDDDLDSEAARIWVEMLEESIDFVGGTS